MLSQTCPIEPIKTDIFFDTVSRAWPYHRKDVHGTSAILQLQKAIISDLEKIYFFDNPKEIINFLIENDDLIAILFEAPAHIYRIFGRVPTHLELHRDPEEGWDELFIVIKSPYSAEEAIQRENRLAEEWFLKKMSETRGNLNITEEPL